ncbi:MAG: L-2-amino-thiazoline-4-carboxylic acid hydrolase [Alphaproteobacteria bacterium]|nr:L-2-amino-thiazoline-4-carboxylic acid hydrolase [Alphaproteobacteria bacterium]MDE2631197.1 L-2-amino-thiazoline-4-carboxylic acid hydrolase [Alphaproteobacteria bacterium]
MDGVRLLYRPLASIAAHRVLIGRLRSRDTAEKGRFTRADVDGLLDAAWMHYRERIGNLPPQPTIGSTMNVRLACFTMSFFDALLVDRIERRYAIELIADAAWWVYRKWAWIAVLLAHMTPGKKVLGFATVEGNGDRRLISLRFPFNAPGYRIETVNTQVGTAFDVVYCPIAAFFRSQDAADLCIASWCNLDYALAEITREKLVRTKTLAGGQDRCDFRVSEGGSAR